jgi:hypothetical protein
MVTGLLDASSPLKEIFKSAKLCAIMAISSDNQRTTVQENTHLGGRMLRLSQHDDVSQY